MNGAAVVDWLKGYMHAWETYSPDAIGELFADDATYSYHPYSKPVVGRQAIVKWWLKGQDAPGTYTADYKPIAVDGDVAVVNGRSTYFKDSSRTEMTKEGTTSLSSSSTKMAGAAPSASGMWRVKVRRRKAD